MQGRAELCSRLLEEVESRQTGEAKVEAGLLEHILLFSRTQIFLKSLSLDGKQEGLYSHSQ